MLKYGFNGQDHAHLFRALHNGAEVSYKNLQGFLGMVRLFILVCLVDGSRLRADNAGAAKGGKPQMGIIAFPDLFQCFLIGICQIQIASQYRQVQAILLKHSFQMAGKARGQGAVVRRIFTGQLAQCHVGTGKALLLCNGHPLFQGRLFYVVKTNSQLHVLPPFPP